MAVQDLISSKVRQVLVVREHLDSVVRALQVVPLAGKAVDNSEELLIIYLIVHLSQGKVSRIKYNGI